MGLKRNQRKLAALHADSKQARPKRPNTAAKTGRVHCPFCGHGNTHVLKAQNGGKLRECNSCEEHWQSPR